MNEIKRFIYHHDWLAKLYNVKRSASRKRHSKLSDEEFAKSYYMKKRGKEINLENPQTFDEKIWYLKFHNRDPLLRKCTDKYLVREYIKECGLEHILNELYGVYDSFESIDFDKLPDKCILKCNHTSGVNAIYDRSRGFDYKYQKNEFDFFMRRDSDSYLEYREWNYKDIERKIVCEKLMIQPGKNCLDDYKFMCFDGKVKLVFGEVGICAQDGSHNADSKRNVYTRDFELLEGVKFTRENFDPLELPKPLNYAKMVEYAEILAKPFIHCRVDLYNIEGEIYFGEITFYHQSGTNKIEPEELAYEAGSWIDLNAIKYYE